MRVYVNDRPVDLVTGMKVRHALTIAGIMYRSDSLWRVYDEWGNELGIDGALSEGAKIYVEPGDESPDIHSSS